MFRAVRPSKVLTKKAVRQLTLVISENSMTSRLEKVKGFNSMNQLQTLNIVTKNVLQLNVHDRIFVEGSTNRGNVLGPLAWDPHDDVSATWSMKIKACNASHEMHCWWNK